MNQSTIKIDVLLDPNKVPEQISWNATDSSADMAQKAKAMCIAFWDGADKTAMRIDLWTKDMMMDEMADFYYQMLMGMADSFKRATQQKEMSDDMKKFARSTIIWVNELKKLVDLKTGKLPRSVLRTVDGARFVREYPEIGTREFVSKALADLQIL